MQPLGFALLAARTPPGIDLELFDDRLETIDYDIDADLVALSVQTFTAKRSYRIADRFRQRGVPVVMGGWHPTLMAEEAQDHADALVVGDGETVWRSLVEDASRGRMKALYMGDQESAMEDLIPDRRIFLGKKYSPLVPVLFGRGCRYACDFCAIHSVYGNTLRQRSVDEIAVELAEIRGRFIFFVDDNLFVNHRETGKLLSAMTPLRKRWVGQVSVDSAWDDGLLESMRKSGCAAVFVGFESLEEENLRQMNKKGNLRWRDYPEAVRRFRDHGIMVVGGFVFGYDHDTPDTIRRALEFSLEQRLCLAHFNPLFPTPGTPLYDRLAAEGRLRFDKWWLSDEYRYGDAMFRPARMTAHELTESCLNARREFCAYSSMLKRALDPKANSRSGAAFGMYLISNLISRREIYRKQGVALG